MRPPSQSELDALLRELPRDIYHTPGQLSHYDRLIYFWAGKVAFTGSGVIVDAGALAGASATLLAHGVRNNKTARFTGAPILSFDQFEDAEGGFMSTAITSFGLTLPPPVNGIVDFEPAFRSVTAAYADLVEVRRGDISTIGYHDARDIEVLSIDVAKTPNLMVAVARDFFPRLVPGHSIVLNQDYIFPHQPWVIIAMELLADCFEPFCEPPRETTMVHRLTKPISASLVQERLGTSGADFYTTENIGLIERARDRLSRTNNQASLQGAYAFALFRGGFVDEARAAARRMVTDYEVTSETFEQKSAFKRLYSELRLELPSI